MGGGASWWAGKRGCPSPSWDNDSQVLRSQKGAVVRNCRRTGVPAIALLKCSRAFATSGCRQKKHNNNRDKTEMQWCSKSTTLNHLQKGHHINGIPRSRQTFCVMGEVGGVQIHFKKCESRDRHSEQEALWRRGVSSLTTHSEWKEGMTCWGGQREG